MASNTSLQIAKDKKDDEFYTQLKDIEKELSHYKEHFKGKKVLCNCDDPYESNFFKYFALKFNDLGLKKLSATCYRGSPIAYTELSLFPELRTEEKELRPPYKAEINEILDYNKDGAIDLSDVEWLLQNHKNSCGLLKGDGDFRSDECLQLLKESDIVVTNPPFSLFREFIETLIKYEKKFLILGPMTATHYKEVFPLIQMNKVWLGFRTGSIQFKVPDNSEEMRNFGNIRWFTNLDIKKRHEDIVLYKTYSPEEYPKYYNFDAIDVGKVSDIPIDYDGYMGVPDNFLEQYNPEQFEIIGIGSGDLAASIGVQKNHRGRTDIAYYDNNGNPKCPYSRIIIKRKK